MKPLIARLFALMLLTACYEVAVAQTVYYATMSTVSIDSDNSKMVSVYPNPAIEHHFYITMPNTGEVNVNIFTLTGQLVMQINLQSATQYPVRLPAQLKPGMEVIVQAVHEGKSASFPLMLR